jgi:uncharacterized membrane protein YccC
LIERTVPESITASVNVPTPTESPVVASTLAELEQLLERMPASLAFLPGILKAWREEAHGLDPLCEPIAERTIFTPACRLSNVEVVRFALKSALAATLCYLIYQGLDWPGISTCVVTCLICAQSSLGAGLNKSLLRIAGATLGGVAALATAVVLLPNIENVAEYVVVLSLLFFGASWLTVGSSRVSYIGLQVGLVLSLVLLNQPDQAIDLKIAGDRIVGVFLGIIVMGFVDFALWPNFASTALRQQLKETLRALALVPRHMARQEWNEAATAALALHGQIAATLALYNEVQFEFGSPGTTAAVDKKQLITFISELEAAFLSLLVVLRRRRIIDRETLPPSSRRCLQALDEAMADNFVMLAAAPDDETAAKPTRPLSELADELRAPVVLAEAGEGAGTKLSDYAGICRELAGTLPKLAALRV